MKILLSIFNRCQPISMTWWMFVYCGPFSSRNLIFCWKKALFDIWMLSSYIDITKNNSFGILNEKRHQSSTLFDQQAVHKRCWSNAIYEHFMRLPKRENSLVRICINCRPRGRCKLEWILKIKKIFQSNVSETRFRTGQ